MSFTSLIALLNKLLDLVNVYKAHKKKKKLKEINEAIDENIETYAASDVNNDINRVFTPNGKPPTISKLRSSTEPEQ